VRFSDQIQIQINVEPQTLIASVPSLILQPLVENAIRHGVDKRALPGIVSITASRNNDKLLLRVKDCGPGLPREWPGEPTGIGILNTKRRLEHLYPSAHEFDLTNAPEGGTIAKITIPFRAELSEQRAGTNHGEKISSAYR
jgi:two-component system LytT family sensor kinase